MTLKGVNILKEDVSMTESQADNVWDQRLCEQESLDRSPDEGEIST